VLVHHLAQRDWIDRRARSTKTRKLKGRLPPAVLAQPPNHGSPPAGDVRVTLTVTPHISSVSRCAEHSSSGSTRSAARGRAPGPVPFHSA
jgi:hypothetical protein